MVYGNHVIEFDRRNPTIRLGILADLHLGSKEFARRHFRAWRDKHKDDSDLHFFLNGDLIEAIGPFDPRFTLSEIDPTHLGKQALIDMQIDDLCQELEPIKHKILGVGMGNHEWEILRRSGTDPTERIARRLGVQNLGYATLRSLTLRPRGQNAGSRIVKYYQHHGWGGGCRTRGGDMTKVSRKPTEFIADIYVVAHSHQKWENPEERIDITSTGRPIARPFLMCNPGTFRKTLSDGPIPTYAERSGFGPQPLGGRIIEIEVDTHNWVKIRTLE